MDRTLDHLGAVGAFTCNNTEKGACSSGCVPDDAKYYNQRQLDPTVCPTKCVDVNDSSVVMGQRSTWCGIRPDDPFSALDTDPTPPPSTSDVMLATTTGATDSSKIDVVTMVKIHIASSKSPSAVSATLLFYSDAIKDLHQDCVTAGSVDYFFQVFQLAR